MTRQEHLLIIAMEECSEVAQRVSKAARFGLDQVQKDADDAPEQNPRKLTNKERITDELSDLMGVLQMLELDGWSQKKALDKRLKVERYLRRSKALGTYTP